MRDLLCRRRAGLPLLVVTSVAFVGTAGAAPANTGIVVEAFEGEAPPDAAALLEAVIDDLDHRGYATRENLATTIRDRLSRDGAALSATDAADAQHAVDIAYQRFIDGEYDRALASAEQALHKYAGATAQLAHEAGLRRLERKAFYIAARSAEVLEQPDDAFSLMAEAIRTFPEDAPASTEFDPRVAALHHRVKTELARQGAGSLEIRCDDPAAVLFVDERFVGTGSVKLEGLPPGRYRVHVEKGSQTGRVRDVDVPSGGAAALTLSWLVDGLVRTPPHTVAIATQGLSPDQVVSGAVQLGRQLGVSKVVVLGVRPIDGRRAVFGLAIDAESQTKTFAALQIEPMPPPKAAVDAMAALLAGERPVTAPGLITEEPRPEVALAESPRRPLGARRRLAIAVGIVALASAGTALGFELSSRTSYDESAREADNARQNLLYLSANRKYQAAQGFAVGALACAAAATALWVTYHPPADQDLVVAATPLGSGLGFTVSGTF